VASLECQLTFNGLHSIISQKIELLIAELEVASAFVNIFGIAHVQLTGDETTAYAQQVILKSVSPCTFHSRIMQQEDVTVDKMYVVLASLC
jgi:hypothetical protein